MEIDFQKVIIWVSLVLLAGFIGQFGKSLSVALIQKFKKKKEALAVQPEETKTDSGKKKITDSMSAEEVYLPDSKALKKLEKARFKMMKKAAKKD